MIGNKKDPVGAIPYYYKNGKWYAGIEKKPNNLATVANTGSYSDLANKPIIPNRYSSTEAVEVGTWIDGRKIYRKVYSGKGNVPLEVTVDRCATVIDMRMVVKNKANNGSWRTVPWLYDTADNTWVAGFYLDSLRSVVVMQLKENMRNAYWWHIVIDYCIEAEQG